MLRDRDIIYFSCLDWGPTRARPQQIALGLAAANRVLYVEPMISLASQLERVVRGQRVRPLLPGFRKIHERLFLYTPPPFLPFSLRSERVNAINKAVLLRSIRWAMNGLRFQQPILAVSHPSHHELIGRLNEQVAFYDCMDHYLVLPDPRADQLVLAVMEAKLLEKADLVFVASERLRAGKEGARGAPMLVRNGVDLAHFDGHGSRCPRTAAELAGVSRPIIGYVGCIGSWFDTEAVSFLAASRPDLSIVLIGPAQDRAVVRKLRNTRNVVLLGPRPYQDLPRYLDAFDVCLIPFQVNELTRAINPIKLYEYLAAGKPVVAADLDEIRPFQHVVSIYATPDELVAKVDRALTERDPEIVRLRVRVASENTWGRRVEELGTALAKYLAIESSRILERGDREEPN